MLGVDGPDPFVVFEGRRSEPRQARVPAALPRVNDRLQRLRWGGSRRLDQLRMEDDSLAHVRLDAMVDALLPRNHKAILVTGVANDVDAAS